MAHDYETLIIKVFHNLIYHLICQFGVRPLFGFTGRISRLVNCLNGFSDKVSIQISTNEEISNIIIVLKNKITDTYELKKAIDMEMTERGYDKETIDIWIGYVE